MGVIRTVVGVLIGIIGALLFLIGLAGIFIWAGGGPGGILALFIFWWIPLLIFCIPGLLLIYIGYRIATGGKEQKISISQQVTMTPSRICPKCGRAIPQDAKLCPYCGAKLEED